MKAITVKQPWTSLIAIGAKKIETRSWATKYRGPLAIHASAKFTKQQRGFCRQNPFASILLESNLFVMEHCLKLREWNKLPFGAVIAICNLVDCLKVMEEAAYPPNSSSMLENNTFVTGNEYAFGDYSIDRYAWLLEGVKQIEPVKCKGRLGLWNLPEEIEEMVKGA